MSMMFTEVFGDQYDPYVHVIDEDESDETDSSQEQE